MVGLEHGDLDRGLEHRSPQIRDEQVLERRLDHLEISDELRQKLIAERGMRMQRVNERVIGQMYRYINDDGIIFTSDTPFTTDGVYFEIEGGVYDGPKSIGTWTRAWKKEEDGWVVTHNNFDINEDEDYQGRGIATEWLKACEKRYLELGVKEVRTRATGVGSYAWARLGFEFSPTEDITIESFRQALDMSIQFGLKSDEISVEEEAFLRAKVAEYVTDDYVDMAALAALDLPGYERLLPHPDETQLRATGQKIGPRHRTLGQVLLTDVEWSGVKKLS